MPTALVSALLVAMPLALGAGFPAPEAGERAGAAGTDGVAYEQCPGPLAYGLVPAMVRCTNGPVQAGDVIAHGFGFPAPGFSGRITSRLVGDAGGERTFTCTTSWAFNAPGAGLVSPTITCGGSGAFPFQQAVTQECIVEGLAPLGSGGSGAVSAGAWSCYLGV